MISWHDASPVVIFVLFAACAYALVLLPARRRYRRTAEALEKQSGMIEDQVRLMAEQLRNSEGQLAQMQRQNDALERIASALEARSRPL